MSKKRKQAKKHSTFHCNICGERIARGKYKKHRIEEHGASKVILKRGPTSKNTRLSPYTVSNIAKPFQGGAVT